MHSATLATLSAVPRSMRFHFRYRVIVGRWIAPGPNTSGCPDAISARTIERIPPTPTRPCGSSSRTSSISASSRSPTCSTGRAAARSRRAEDELERACSAALDERRRSARRPRWRSGARTRPRRRRARRRRTERPGSMLATRAKDLLGGRVDSVGVEHLVIGLEQPPDTGLVHLHLRAADRQRPEHELAVVVPQVVGRLRPSRPRGSAAL